VPPSRLSARSLSSGLVIAIVGFFSSFPIVLQGLTGVGADATQAASALMAAAIAMGLAGIGLSLWTKQPVSVAWSTPGVALLAVTPQVAGGFSGAVAGFLFAGLLTVVAGLWRPLGRLAMAIPGPLAQAMLAGVLISLCTVPFRALAETPWTALPIVLTWFVVSRFSRLAAVPAAVVATALVIALSPDFRLPEQVFSVPTLILPEMSMAALLSIGLPLFVVTMATQNIPGIAILRSYGFAPPPGPVFAAVGGASVLSAPLGAPATCVAAITGAMASSEEAHPDPAERYRSAAVAGFFYCVFGLFAGAVTGIAALAPPGVMGTLAGVALLGTFANAARAALDDPDYREAAAITFLATASGLTLFGLGSAVWGLVLGGLVQILAKALGWFRRGS